MVVFRRIWSVHHVSCDAFGLVLCWAHDHDWDWNRNCLRMKCSFMLCTLCLSTHEMLFDFRDYSCVIFKTFTFLPLLEMRSRGKIGFESQHKPKRSRRVNSKNALHYWVEVKVRKKTKCFHNGEKKLNDIWKTSVKVLNKKLWKKSFMRLLSRRSSHVNHESRHKHEAMLRRE